MPETKPLETIVERMATADVRYVTTIGTDGYPRTHAMLNLRNREQYPDQVKLYAELNRDLMVYIATTTSSAKKMELDSNPRICVYFCHPSEFFGVSLVGDAELIEDMAAKEAPWVDWWSRYDPTGLPDDPDFTVFRLFPKEARGWNQGEKFAIELPA